MKFLENLENLKKQFKIRENESFDDWNSYTKKLQYTKKTTPKKFYKLIFLKSFIIKKIIKNLEFYKITVNSFINKLHKCNFNIDKSINYLYSANNKNIKSTVFKNSSWSNKNLIFIVIDQRSLKTKIIFFKKNKCLCTITNGLIFKKLQFNNKKYKKSEKISLLSVKAVCLQMQNYINKKNLIIHVKGLKKNSNNLLKYFNTMIVKYKCLNSIYLNNFMINNNKYFGFKKIKSIKRRLKKKIIKLK